ncbi:MAG: glycolate oxidase subunit GlcE [Burkholderiaceae bacterium]|nr:glycolate oxidase subunit GlcE [Burkholderiaceae bacterium]
MATVLDTPESATVAIQNLADKVRHAAEKSSPLRIRGGGSKDFYGQQLCGDVLDMRAFAGVVEYEPSELVATVLAGTRLRDLTALLAEHGQYLPFDPPRFSSSTTVGGMVAAGLSGPARASVGAVRDFVLGVQIIDGRGQWLNFGGQVMKNVAGYDVSRLMAGALGTLGVLVQVSLKVLPVPPADATLLFDLAETSARQQINRWCGQPLPLHASCWDDGVLAVRLRGAQAAVEAAQRQMGGEVMETNTAERRWQALRDQTLPFFQRTADQVLWRIGVPDTAPPLNLGPTLVEWHGAQRWVKLPLQATSRVREVSVRAGGHATLFRGGGNTGQDYDVPVFTPLAPPLARIHAALKKQFDPAGILNPGRLYPAF